MADVIDDDCGGGRKLRPRWWRTCSTTTPATGRLLHRRLTGAFPTTYLQCKVVMKQLSENRLQQGYRFLLPCESNGDLLERCEAERAVGKRKVTAATCIQAYYRGHAARVRAAERRQQVDRPPDDRELVKALAAAREHRARAARVSGAVTSPSPPTRCVTCRQSKRLASEEDDVALFENNFDASRSVRVPASTMLDYAPLCRSDAHVRISRSPSSGRRHEVSLIRSDAVLSDGHEEGTEGDDCGMGESSSRRGGIDVDMDWLHSRDPTAGLKHLSVSSACDQSLRRQEQQCGDNTELYVAGWLLDEPQAAKETASRANTAVSPRDSQQLDGLRRISRRHAALKKSPGCAHRTRSSLRPLDKAMKDGDTMANVRREAAQRATLRARREAAAAAAEARRAAIEDRVRAAIQVQEKEHRLTELAARLEAQEDAATRRQAAFVSLRDQGRSKMRGTREPLWKRMQAKAAKEEECKAEQRRRQLQERKKRFAPLDIRKQMHSGDTVELQTASRRRRKQFEAAVRRQVGELRMEPIQDAVKHGSAVENIVTTDRSRSCASMMSPPRHISRPPQCPSSNNTQRHASTSKLRVPTKRAEQLAQLPLIEAPASQVPAAEVSPMGTPAPLSPTLRQASLQQNSHEYCDLKVIVSGKDALYEGTPLQQHTFCAGPQLYRGKAFRRAMEAERAKKEQAAADMAAKQERLNRRKEYNRHVRDFFAPVSKPTTTTPTFERKSDEGQKYQRSYMSEIFGGAKGTRPKCRYAARSEAVVVPRMLSWRESGRVLPAMACRHGGAGGTHGVSHAKGYFRYMASGCCSTSASRERASSARLHALGDAHKGKAPPRGALYPKAMPKPRRSEILDTVTSRWCAHR